MNRYTLNPTDGRKSFYNKMYVEAGDDKVITLFSYNTRICEFNSNTKEFKKLYYGYSVTTMRHIDSFIAHIGIEGGGKKWWESL